MTSNSKAWSEYAELRHDQISSGVDISMNKVIEPNMLESIREMGAEFSSILDVGCGTGHFTALLVKFSKSVKGVDPSRASIAIAKREYSNLDIKFYNSTVEKYSIKSSQSTQFSLITANMVLMNVEDIDSFLYSVASLQEQGGKFVLSVIHPSFWPIYKGYDRENIDYLKDFKISEPFRLSLDDEHDIKTFHYHRSLQSYVSSFRKAGYVIRDIKEAWPDSQTMKQYPSKWKFPRFMIIVLDKF